MQVPHGFADADGHSEAAPTFHSIHNENEETAPIPSK
jgi:hypothetical protein